MEIIKYSALHISLICAVILLITSCIEEYYDDNTTGGGVGDNLSMVTRIPLPSGDGQTRAENGEILATSFAEILIEDIRVAMYADDGDGEGYKVKYSFDLNIDLYASSLSDIEVKGLDVLPWNKDDGIKNNNILITTRARTFKPGDYQMLVVVNPNDKIKEMTNVGEKINRLDEPFDVWENEVEDYSLYKRLVMIGTKDERPSYFLMSNVPDLNTSTGLKEIKSTDFKPTREEAEAEENRIPVNVERVTAKVDCKYDVTPQSRSHTTSPHGRFVVWIDPAKPGDDSEWDIPDDCLACEVCGKPYDRNTKLCENVPPHRYGHYDGLGLISEKVQYIVATDFMWQVDVINKKSYWLRRFDESGHSKKREYAKDPNYDNIPSSSEANYNEFIKNNFSEVITKIETPENQDIYKGTGRLPRRLTPPLPVTINGEVHDFSKLWKWDATQADNLPVYIPENTIAMDEQRGDVTTRVLFKATLKKEYNNDAKKGIGNFFVFRGGRSTKGRYDNIDNNGASFYILRPSDVKRYYNDPTIIPETLEPDDPSKIKFSDALNQFLQDNSNFSFNDDDDLSNQPAATSSNLTFYKNSTLYYSVPVEHFGDSNDKYGYFGIVRNHHYTLNVTKIHTIGEPWIPARSDDKLLKENNP